MYKQRAEVAEAQLRNLRKQCARIAGLAPDATWTDIHHWMVMTKNRLAQYEETK